MTTLSVFGVAWLVFGAFGISATLQSWYRKVYDEPPSQGAAKQLAAQAFWLAGFLAYLTVQVLIGRQVGSFGAHVLIFVTEFGLAVVFWTFSPYLLLLGKIAMAGRAPRRDCHRSLSDRAKHLFRTSAFVIDRLWQ